MKCLNYCNVENVIFAIYIGYPVINNKLKLICMNLQWTDSIKLSGRKLNKFAIIL